jgi:hypothetical protein
MTILTTQDGRVIHLLSVVAVTEQEDGSLSVFSSGGSESEAAASTHLDAGEDVQAFKEATQRVAPPPFEQEMPGQPLLERLRAQSE